MSDSEATYTWVRALVDELALGGVEHAVICPGSRSTPLAVTLADHGSLEIHSVLDERTAGFFGLGIALATNRPVALVATSGTAGAHFLPAVIEAAMSQVPLVVLTADRPWELQSFGAAQTIPQQHLYGSFAREFLDLPVPEGTPTALAHLRAAVARAVSRTREPLGGTVHLNIPFREPLAPTDTTRGPWTHPSSPALTFAFSARAPDADALAQLARELASIERGVIVCGPRRFDDGFGSAVRDLGAALGFPVIAEIASQARFGSGHDVIAHADLLLSSANFVETHRPDVVLRFGGGLTSKRLLTWLEAASQRTVLFSDGGSLVDPAHRADTVIEGSALQACVSLTPCRPPRASAWQASFLEAERRTRATLEASFSEDTRLTEPRIAREVVAGLPEGASLFLSSSMPIREGDAYAAPRAQALRVFANRGANGIDGIVSSALGVAVGSRRPTVLLTGDLALLHDVGALLIAHRHRISLTVVIVNNDGGGIFSFLPIAHATPHFEELFATPHGLQFEHAAHLYGARYARPTSVSRLRSELAASTEGGFHLIEVPVDRAINPAVHQQLAQRVQATLSEDRS